MKNILLLLVFFSVVQAEQSVAQTILPGKEITNSVCSPRSDIHFQSGTLNGWDAYYAVDASTSAAMVLNGKTGGACGSVNDAGGPDPNTGNSYQVQLMTTPGCDSIAGALIPFTPPMGGLSAMVGDGPANGYGVGILEQTYLIDSSAPILTIQYAVVMEYQSSHVGYEQPWFLMQVLDLTGNPVVGCGQYLVTAGPGLPGFVPKYYALNGDTVYCRPWATAFVPLYNYIGQCVTVRFTSSDCSLGGHFGYAYVASTCSKPALRVSPDVFCTGQQAALITAPPTATYQWSTTAGCIAGSTIKQALNVVCAGTYNVILQSSAGAQCVDTLSVVIPAVPNGPPPIACFTATSVCAGVSTHFDASCSTPSTGVKYYWDFYNSGSYNNSSGATPVWTYTSSGTYTVRLHLVTAGGCSADTSIAVFSTAPTEIPTFSATVTQPSTCVACNGKIALTVYGASVLDTVRTSFDNTIGLMVTGLSGSVTSGTKNCGVIAGPGFKYTTMSFCNLCSGVYQFYVIPSAPTLPYSCVPNGYYGDTVTVVVNSPGAVVPIISISNDTAFSTHASSYQWYFNGNLITGAIDSFYVMNNVGTYQVFTIDINGCGQMSEAPLYRNRIITGISSVQSEGDLKVYPNPASGKAIIQFNRSVPAIYHLALVDMTGRELIIKEGIAGAGLNNVELDLHNLSKGIYIVNLSSGDRVSMISLAVE